MVELVNVVTRDTSMDVAGWRIGRLLSMAAAIEADARRREDL